jgi:hypothetical protein
MWRRASARRRIGTAIYDKRWEGRQIPEKGAASIVKSLQLFTGLKPYTT